MKKERLIATIWAILLGAFCLMLASNSSATVSVSDNRIQYLCDGTETTYAYDFLVYEDDDLTVTYGTRASTPTALVLNTDYTVTGAGDASGGDVELTAGSTCPDGSYLTITRDVELTQDTDYVDGQAFSAESLETLADKLTLIQQDQQEKIDRSAKVPQSYNSSSVTTMDIPVSAGRVWGWNSAGTAPTTYSTGSVQAQATFDTLANYADLATACAALGAGETLYIQSAAVIADGVTVTCNCDIVIDEGSVDGTAGGGTETLVLNGGFLLGHGEKFGENLTVTISNNYDRMFSWFSSSAQMVSAMVRGATLIIDGTFDMATAEMGVISSTIPFNISGWHSVDNSAVGYGSKLVNEGLDSVDSPVILFDVASQEEKLKISGIHIHHEGATSDAIVIDNVIHSVIEDSYIDLDDAGHGGVRYANNAFFARINRTRIRDFVSTGVEILGNGSEYVIIDCQVASSQASSVGVHTMCEGTHVIRGQINVSGAGGKNIHFDSDGSPILDGGYVKDVLMENLAADGYGVYVGGVGQSGNFESVVIEGLQANVNSGTNDGTLVMFDDTNYSKFINPVLQGTATPAATTRLVNFGAGSNSCELVCDYPSSLIKMDVDAASVRCIKKVTSPVTRGNLPNVTIDDATSAVNVLTTKMDGGVIDSPPGFVPTYNGTGWNIQWASIADDAATSFTPPTAKGKITIYADDDLNDRSGIFFYDTSAPELTAIHAGTNLANTTGVLAHGTHTGTDNAAVLTDSTASFTIDDLVGQTLYNVTDGSSTTVTANTATTVTGVLSGGTDDDWDTDDVYIVQAADAKVTISVHATDGKIYLANRIGNAETFTITIESISYGF